MTYAVRLPTRDVFAAWRSAARRAISHRIAPADLDWAPQDGLFSARALPDDDGPHQARVSKDFLRFAKSVLWHRAPERFDLMYQALWRLDSGAGDPTSQADPLGRRLQLMAKSVGRDIHKMHAFVRFRELPAPGPRRRFAAWFEPEHLTLEPASSFFAKRFADMDWAIFTPDLSAHFTDGALDFHQGQPRPDLPDDASEALWGTYFTNIFNPARIKLQAMRSEMPKKYWHNMPETRLIPAMLRDAERRVRQMHEAAGSMPDLGAQNISARYRAAMPAAPDLPETLEQAEAAAAQCRRCNLCEAATQTVWGRGAPDAALMIVGEQPGDHEDLAGVPFVGPAGQVLHRAMAEARLATDQVWLTNAVKHFKFAPRGKQRMHKSPDGPEIAQCRWWLGLELAFIKPRLTVALGATAAAALTGDTSPLAARRGAIETGLHGGPVLIAWHPSYILRLPHVADKDRVYSELLHDLQHAHQLIQH
ncbi:UdgX family uracil-DNA binding protein [Ketogulonicigenium vulgare]|uniref:Type-4 uracil-DNA glycosylase n=1 Tax=Ketogulonicigenium vulgare (strain WSH-001) TaxID=759362 RepID=F9YBR1_KETVW|nr:UdgX family uracil-DNA binding protein [Ketogulonicigenium vulgare]AEM42813.1 Uracil-DNA glycosylase superfamily protein [Ketogulonicigenium vulgare WSH-001]